MFMKTVLTFGIFLGPHVMFTEADEIKCWLPGIPFTSILPICFVKYVRIAIEEATHANVSATNQNITEKIHFNYVDCVSKRVKKQLKSYTDDIQDVFGDDVIDAIETAERNIHDFITHDVEDFFIHGIKYFFENDVTNLFKNDTRKFFEHDVKYFFIEDVKNFFLSNVTIFFNRDVKNFFTEDVKYFFVNDVKHFFEKDLKALFVTPSTNGCQKEEYRKQFLVLSFVLSILLFLDM